MPEGRQGWLLPYLNPLESRMAREFFRALPRTPGVYFMKGAAGEILYVGKAKNLQARLYSYRRAKPDQVSRKVLRMLRMVRTIEWEHCESEEAALLRENELLRRHRPPFNVMNTSPESYFLIGMCRRERQLMFRLTTDEESACEPGELLYGAYKGRGAVRDGYAALIRLIWACHHAMEQLGYPMHLHRAERQPRFEVGLGEALSETELRSWESAIRRFLNGTSRALLPRLTEALLANEDIPRFTYRAIQEDLERLTRFYEFGPGRNRRLKRHHGLFGQRQIPQAKLDDWLVIYRTRMQEKARKKAG